MAESRVSATVARVKGIIDFVERGGDIVEIQRRLIALEAEIVSLEERNLSLDQRALALSQENDELKKRQSELEAFDVDHSEYADYRLPSGAWVVIARRIGETEFGEPGMYLCRRCFTHRRYEVLQPVHSGRALECHECRSLIEKEAPVRGSITMYESPWER